MYKAIYRGCNSISNDRLGAHLKSDRKLWNLSLDLCRALLGAYVSRQFLLLTFIGEKDIESGF